MAPESTVRVAQSVWGDGEDLRSGLEQTER